MTTLIMRFPSAQIDDPVIWLETDGIWQPVCALSEYVAGESDATVMALVSPADARCIWSAQAGLEPRQAESVAKLKAIEQSIGPVHVVARHILDDMVIAATISPAAMEYGLERLALAGLNPDIVIPAGLAIDAHPDHVVKAGFDGMSCLRGRTFATPDEPVLRELLVGDNRVEEATPDNVQTMLQASSLHPVLNLREGLFAKREQIVWMTPLQRKWIARLLAALLAATILLAIVTWAKYTNATSAEDDRALAAARKIDPSIRDIAMAESQLDRALLQKGITRGRLTPLSAGLWRTVKAAPNVSVRELRYGTDGIMTVVLVAPDNASINRALVAVQQDGYSVTATPRQDNSGAMLVDLTMRMP